MELAYLVFILSLFYQMLPRRCLSTEDEEAIVKLTVHGNNKDSDKTQNDPEYEAEKKAGDPSDTFGSNQHRSYPFLYRDLSRRFVPVYPYTELQKETSKTEVNMVKQKSFNEELIPIEAAPDKVLAVAIMSAREQASMPINNSEVVKNEKEILRTGDYWNAVWVEDVDPKSVLRSYTRHQLVQEKQKKYRSTSPKLGSVRAKIMPGSKLYQLVSVLQQFSPRLLYVINNNK